MVKKLKLRFRLGSCLRRSDGVYLHQTGSINCPDLILTRYIIGIATSRAIFSDGLSPAKRRQYPLPIRINRCFGANTQAV